MQLHCRVIACQRIIAPEDTVISPDNTDNLCFNNKTGIKFGLLQSTCGLFQSSCFKLYSNVFPKHSRVLLKSVNRLLQFETFLYSVLWVLSKAQRHVNIDIFTWFKICTKECVGGTILLWLLSQQKFQNEHQSNCCPSDDWCICFEEISSSKLSIASCKETYFELLDKSIWIAFAFERPCAGYNMMIKLISHRPSINCL